MAWPKDHNNSGDTSLVGGELGRNNCRIPYYRRSQETLLKEGLGSVRARYLGDKKVLLTGHDGGKDGSSCEG